jgi:hypothetical protein
MSALARATVLSLMCISVAIAAAGCATTGERINYTPPHSKPEPRTIQVFAGSSLKHPNRFVREDPTLRDQVFAAFRKRFPNVELVESKPDVVVFFNIVDYEPGCLPNCGKFRTYRNWGCEVEAFPQDSEANAGTLVFNFDGHTYNPLYDAAANCAARFAKVMRR